MLDFVSDITETPILIDSPSHTVKIAGTLHAAEIGISERVIYNSLIPESKPEEYEAIQETKLESAILLAYQTGFMTSKGRVEAINELYPKAVQSGIKKPLVDAFVIDVPTLSMASKAIIEIKKEMGLPCGCGAHNAISTWSGFKKRMGKQAVTPCTTVVNTFPVALGADFILYGPIESCKYVFPAVSTLNSSYKF